MKKTLLAVILAVACVACLAACGGSEPAPAPAPETQSQAPVVASVPVMTHEEYVAAPLDSQVCVETYIQAKQSWWENQATIYTQAEDGAYFLYNMPCTEEDFNNVLTVGTKIKVTGFKSEWSGEVEIIDATYEVLDGNFVAEPADVTALLGTDELIAHQNEFVSFADLKVAASKDADGNDAAYLYNWDGSGSQGDDLYFNVEDANGNVYQFTVESYLCGADTEVYKAVEALQIGQTVDLQGFLYWYEGVNPHITNVVVK